VLSSPDGREWTWIGCNATHLIVDQRNSSLAPDLTPEELKHVSPQWWFSGWVSNHTVLSAPLPYGESHRMHAFLDGSTLEVFCDERVAITTNVFPTLETASCVNILPGSGVISSAAIYPLKDALVSGVPP
jgi:hypothetical protein